MLRSAENQIELTEINREKKNVDDGCTAAVRELTTCSAASIATNRANKQQKNPIKLTLNEN